MKSALEFFVNRRLIRQVFFDLSSETHYISPGGHALPLVVTSGNISFPVVEVKQVFGPFSVIQTYLPENPPSLEEFLGQDIQLRLKDEKLSKVNGFLPLSEDRVRITPRDKFGNLIQSVRERECIKYNLLEYSATDRVILKGIGGGEMY